MSRKSEVPVGNQQTVRKAAQVGRVSTKGFRADAFDDFIEEQLKKQKSSGDDASDEIVCHVY